MAQTPLTMELIKQVFRLKRDGISIRETARRLGISRNSVKKYLARLPQESACDEPLAGKVYNNDSLAHNEQRMAELYAHFKGHSEELSKTTVTRQLLWQEYLQQHPDGYSYSRYSYHLQQYFKRKDLSMHLEYSPGDMIMVDFAGKRQHYADPDS